jgi:ABC-type spermidine/putrescine transport system permease subunit II
MNLPSSISLSPKGGDAQPTSTWSVMTAVSVALGLPVACGIAVSLNSSRKARTTLWVEDPLVE